MHNIQELRRQTQRDREGGREFAGRPSALSAAEGWTYASAVGTLIEGRERARGEAEDGDSLIAVVRGTDGRDPPQLIRRSSCTSGHLMLPEPS